MMKNIQKINLKTIDLDPKHLVNYAETLQRLSNPNIVKIYASYIEGDFFCFVSETSKEGNLKDFIKGRTNVLTENEVLNIGCQISSGISYLHSQEILLRHLKPENILRFSNGLFKIGGFSFDHLLNNPIDNTNPLDCIYKAPELFSNLPYSFSTDSWSLGCVLYEILTLKPPFRIEPDVVQLIKKIQNENPAQINGYSSEVVQLVSNLLEKNPKQRLSTQNCSFNSVFNKSYFDLGLKFFEGSSVSPDIQTSMLFFLKSAQSGNENGMDWYNKASELLSYPEISEVLSSRDFATFSRFCKKIEKNIPLTKNQQKDLLYIFKKASESNNPRAMFCYGFVLQDPLSVHQLKDSETMQWYKKSADAGDPFGINGYGLCVEDAFGFPLNQTESMRWFKKAAGAGCLAGMSNLARALYNGFDANSVKKEAFFWSKIAAEGGDFDGMFMYATLRKDNFEGIPKDMKEALIWFKKSAESGHHLAMKNYAGLLKEGFPGFQPNRKEYLIWIRKSSDFRLP